MHQGRQAALVATALGALCLLVMSMRGPDLTNIADRREALALNFVVRRALAQRKAALQSPSTTTANIDAHHSLTTTIIEERPVTAATAGAADAAMVAALWDQAEPGLSSTAADQNHEAAAAGGANSGGGGNGGGGSGGGGILNTARGSVRLSVTAVQGEWPGWASDGVISSTTRMLLMQAVRGAQNNTMRGQQPVRSAQNDAIRILLQAGGGDASIDNSSSGGSNDINVHHARAPWQGHQSGSGNSSSDSSDDITLHQPLNQGHQGGTNNSISDGTDDITLHHPQDRAHQGGSGIKAGFVKTDGPNFVVDGKVTFFSGTNAFGIALVDHMSEDDVRAELAGHAAKGATLMRFFAFSNGNNLSNIPTPTALQPEPYKYGEEAFRRMDVALAEGAKLGIRFILALANFESELGGMQWYVDNLVGPGHPKELFYSSEEVRDCYKAYVTTIINRVNTINGVAYKNDPTVFAWELMNEPHTTDQYEQSQGLPPGRLVNGWLEEMSSFIKGLDANHMVATGEEGYRSDGPSDPPHNNWMNSGFKGVDFAANVQLPDIDFATVHCYPDNWDIPAYYWSWVYDNFLADRAAIAHAAGKPIVLEEYGARGGYLPTRGHFVRSMSGWAIQLGYGATLVWEVYTSSRKPGPMQYTFGYEQDGGPEAVAQNAAMRQRSMP